MSLLQINTAIPLALAEPLLEQKKEEERSVTVTTRRESSESSGSSNSNSNSQYRTKFVVLGALTGFFIQVVSLGAYAFLLVHNNQSSKSLPMSAEVEALTESGIFNNSENTNNNDSEDDEEGMFGTDTIMYTILSVLTQVDLIVYVLIWVAFTCTMTRNGMSCIRSQFFVTEEEDDFDDFDDDTKKKISSANKKDNKIIKRRYVFVLGVYFLVGIVLGAFGAWSAIDMYLGFPIPFQPILTTVAVDLVLCYLMVWCYDLGKKKKRRRSAIMLNNEEQEQETIEFISSSSNYDSDDDDDDEDCEPAMCC